MSYIPIMMAFLTSETLADLRHRHAEPHRKLHTWDRVGELLQFAEDVVNGIAERPAFILAILFHKSVFTPRATDSATRSVELMRTSIGASAPPGTLDRAEALIRAIDEREVPETDDPSLRGDAALLLDFDNAVLGDDARRFSEYEEALRQEAAHLPAERYRMARSAALQMLLWKNRIFHTDRFYLEREKRARRNIEGAIAHLEAA
jgi:predicted metal-dependent HD superfamily phosphohydrolase